MLGLQGPQQSPAERLSIFCLLKSDTQKKLVKFAFFQFHMTHSKLEQVIEHIDQESIDGSESVKPGLKEVRC